MDIIISCHESLLGFQTSIHGYFQPYQGLPFAIPLIRGIVVFPVAFVGALYTLQYGLTSDVYFDESDGEAREAQRPKLQ